MDIIGHAAQPVESLKKSKDTRVQISAKNSIARPARIRILILENCSGSPIPASILSIWATASNELGGSYTAAASVLI